MNEKEFILVVDPKMCKIVIIPFSQLKVMAYCCNKVKNNIQFTL